VLVEERLPVSAQILADLLVLRMFDDQLSDLFVAEVDGGQKRLVDASAVDVIEKKLDCLCIVCIYYSCKTKWIRTPSAMRQL